MGGWYNYVAVVLSVRKALVIEDKPYGGKRAGQYIWPA
jgi:hypothetical protein